MSHKENGGVRKGQKSVTHYLDGHKPVVSLALSLNFFLSAISPRAAECSNSKICSKPCFGLLKQRLRVVCRRGQVFWLDFAVWIWTKLNFNVMCSFWHPYSQMSSFSTIVTKSLATINLRVTKKQPPEFNCQNFVDLTFSDLESY